MAPRNLASDLCLWHSRSLGTLLTHYTQFDTILHSLGKSCPKALHFKLVVIEIGTNRVICFTWAKNDYNWAIQDLSMVVSTLTQTIAVTTSSYSNYCLQADSSWFLSTYWTRRTLSVHPPVGTVMMWDVSFAVTIGVSGDSLSGIRYVQVVSDHLQTLMPLFMLMRVLSFNACNRTRHLHTNG